ncbi:hypothetical protein [Raoultella ornithinolytica]|uniref:hypothetical protein n=1 Tax=Raoultella ornithinolytica TaxID=54291 RepID=UPI002DBA9E3E|nr:hypothetical protein [Raoultella ornithinolytica]MEB7957362.1 hypothetical protein [Raoultella ornithinolytica]
MHLVKTTEFNGVTIEDARYVIDEINIQGGEMSFAVCMMSATSNTRLSGVNYACPYDEEGASPKSQALTYLKTLTAFSGATEQE